MDDPLGLIILSVVFLVAGGFLRAAEAASLMVEDSALDALKKDRPILARRAQRLAAAAKTRYGTLSLSYQGVFALGCVYACAWLIPFLRGFMGKASFFAWLIAIIMSLSVFHAFAGLLPSYAAAKNAEKTLQIAANPAWLIMGIFSPVANLARAIAGVFAKFLKLHPSMGVGRVTEQEIRMMVDIGEEKGEIEADEKQMIENIFEFNNMSAEDSMTHRKDITFIDIESTDAQILSTIRASGLSRFPVYEDDIDHVVGILTTRDYLLNRFAPAPKPVKSLLRPAYFVPETVKTDRLFSEMQKRKQHMAIVVDEYGGTSGLVTLEDLLEEIVGNIYDEFDPQEAQEIVPLGDGRFRVRGSADLESVSEALGVSIDVGDEYDTVGGLIFSRLNEIPPDGTRPVVTCFGLRIQVEKIFDRRVDWAIVEKIAPDKR